MRVKQFLSPSTNGYTGEVPLYIVLAFNGTQHRLTSTPELANPARDFHLLLDKKTETNRDPKLSREILNV